MANISSHWGNIQSIHFQDNSIAQLAKYYEKLCNIAKAALCVLTHCLNFAIAASPERGGRKGRVESERAMESWPLPCRCLMDFTELDLTHEEEVFNQDFELLCFSAILSIKFK